MNRGAASGFRAPAGAKYAVSGGLLMRLFEEILSAAGFDEELSFGGAKVVLFAGRCGYFENVRGIASFSDTAVELLLKRGEVHIGGKGLHVARYGSGDLLLKGDIERVELIGGRP